MKIAVIGGGVSGLVAAWLLEEQHDVTLYERGEVLGGHAHTVGVNLAGGRFGVDAGIHLFHPKQFPRFSRLLEHLDVGVRRGPVRITFEDRAREERTILPPLRNRFPVLPIGRFGKVGDHLLFARLLRAGRVLVDSWDTETTLHGLVAYAGVPESFVRELLAPMSAAMWGVDTVEEMLHFSALAPLWYMTRFEFSAAEVLGGTRAYIRRLVANMSHAHIRAGRPIASVTRVADGWRVHEPGGVAPVFDQVVLATNATSARALLGAAAPPALQDFRYYRSTIAVHGDVGQMPDRRAWWSYCNVRFDGRRSRATLWKGQWDDRPLFTTWLHGGERPPDRLHALVSFEHPEMTPAHFRAQRQLDEAQGQGGLWFAGVYTGGVDSHESGVDSAWRVVSGLDAGVRRLAILGPRGRGLHTLR